MKNAPTPDPHFGGVQANERKVHFRMHILSKTSRGEELLHFNSNFRI